MLRPNVRTGLQSCLMIEAFYLCIRKKRGVKNTSKVQPQPTLSNIPSDPGQNLKRPSEMALSELKFQTYNHRLLSNLIHTFVFDLLTVSWRTPDSASLPALVRKSPSSCGMSCLQSWAGAVRTHEQDDGGDGRTQ